MHWYCVHIVHSRSFDAMNRTFVSLLKSEPRNHETECPVYGQSASDGDGFNYSFSPRAVIQYHAFIQFWGGFECLQPLHLQTMSRVI
jgi:hypothetical protein